ncbi:glycine N-acyltransferase-like [Mixophyes fleayi]|uniref:glycine N-acyltransferase-like n=1 Tax=Mixophyes fleayi TaxID=3061075 RepID=UPI003F4E3705
MLFLTCSSKLVSLRRLLIRSFPESLKVCGALHHIIHDNPFRLQVLVDQWPEFTSVICRPPLEEMTDPLDPYTNTYFVFSKDPQSLHQMLQDPQTIKWNQELYIRGCQPELGKVLQEVSSSYGSTMHTTSNLLYMRDGMEKEEMEQSTISSDELQFTPLLTHEAPLVQGQSVFRNNKFGLHFVDRCIQNFPNVCIRKKGVNQPIAWSVTEHSAEIRMGYTEPAYRNMGLARIVLLKLAAVNHSRGAPIYAHAVPDNKKSQAAMQKAGFRLSGRWLLWSFQQQILNAKY